MGYMSGCEPMLWIAYSKSRLQKSLPERLRNGKSQKRRNGIANLTECRVHGAGEAKSVREGLQPCRLSDRNCPLLPSVIMNV